jgi:hypothetical protein
LIVSLIYFTRKTIAYGQRPGKIKLDHEKNLMAATLEIQESTFHIFPENT